MDTDHISSNGSLFSWISNTEHLWKWKVLIHQITKYYKIYLIPDNKQLLDEVEHDNYHELSKPWSVLFAEAEGWGR